METQGERYRWQHYNSTHLKTSIVPGMINKWRAIPKYWLIYLTAIMIIEKLLIKAHWFVSPPTLVVKQTGLISFYQINCSISGQRFIKHIKQSLMQHIFFLHWQINLLHKLQPQLCRIADFFLYCKKKKTSYFQFLSFSHFKYLS